MRRLWLRVIVSFLCGFTLVLLLYRTSSELSRSSYPTPAAGSSRAIAQNTAESVWFALDWSRPAFYRLFPPVRGQKVSVGAVVGPIITNIVVATLLFYAGFTWYAR